MEPSSKGWVAYDGVRQLLVKILESFLSDLKSSERDCLSAMEVAVDYGFPDIAVCLGQLRTDMKTH